jgi:hypothetical protein
MLLDPVNIKKKKKHSTIHENIVCKHLLWDIFTAVKGVLGRIDLAVRSLMSDIRVNVFLN